MGNSSIKLNTLAICSVTFMSVAIFSWVVFILILMFKDLGTDDELPQIKWSRTISLWSGILFTFGAALCAFFNRTNWGIPGSIGNWDNSLFFSGIPIYLVGIVMLLYVINVKEPPLFLSEHFICVRIIPILFTIIGSWLFLIPDLMPENCLPR